MWELNHKEGWAPKNWCFQIVVLEKILESPLYCKEVKPVNPKGNQPWVFIERTDAEAEAQMLWLPDTKNWLTGKDLMLGKIEDKRRRGQETMRWLDSITNSMDRNLSELPEIVKDPGEPGVLQSIRSQRDWTWLSNWTTTGRTRRERALWEKQPATGSGDTDSFLSQVAEIFAPDPLIPTACVPASA